MVESTVSQKTTQKKRQRARLPPKDPFVNLTPAQANREKGTLTARAQASQVYYDHLSLNANQTQSIEALYQGQHTIDHIYSTSHADQIQATAFLVSHQLDVASREAPDDRWSIKWQDTYGKEGICRVLLQWCVSFCSQSQSK
jgi:hypothetical protein